MLGPGFAGLGLSVFILAKNVLGKQCKHAHQNAYIQHSQLCEIVRAVKHKNASQSLANRRVDVRIQVLDLSGSERIHLGDGVQLVPDILRPV